MDVFRPPDHDSGLHLPSKFMVQALVNLSSYAVRHCTTNQTVTKSREKRAVENNVRGRMENNNVVGWGAGGVGASATSKHRGRGARGGTTRVVMELHHQRLKVRRGSRSTLRRHGMWPHDLQAPSRRVSISHGFWLGVAVIIEFRHWQWGLGEGTWTSGDITHSGAEPRGVRTAETMLEEDLDGGRHGPTLPMGQGPENQVRRGRRLRDRDYATGPGTDRWIRTVTLLLGP